MALSRLKGKKRFLNERKALLCCPLLAFSLSLSLEKNPLTVLFNSGSPHRSGFMVSLLGYFHTSFVVRLKK